MTCPLSCCYHTGAGGGCGRSSQGRGCERRCEEGSRGHFSSVPAHPAWWDLCAATWGGASDGSGSCALGPRVEKVPLGWVLRQAPDERTGIIVRNVPWGLRWPLVSSISGLSACEACSPLLVGCFTGELYNHTLVRGNAVKRSPCSGPSCWPILKYLYTFRVMG